MAGSPDPKAGRIVDRHLTLCAPRGEGYQGQSPWLVRSTAFPTDLSPWAEGPRADKSPPAFLRFLLPSGGSKWTPYWITFGLPPTRIDRHPGRGNANSNPASAGRESTANPTFSKRRPGQPRSFETGAGERMHAFPSTTSVSISSSICDSYTVSWLARIDVAIE